MRDAPAFLLCQKLCPNRIFWNRLGCLVSEEQIPQIVVSVRNSRKTMEPLEPASLPWAQGVGRSNRPAPTNRINSSADRPRLCPGLYAKNGGRPQSLSSAFKCRLPRSLLPSCNALRQFQTATTGLYILRRALYTEYLSV